MSVSQLALLLFFGFLMWDSRPLRMGSAFTAALSFDLYCNSTTTCTENAECIISDGFCECVDGYQFALDHGEQVCRRCPGLHEACDTDCCYPPNLTACIKRVCQCNGNFYDASCSTMDQYKLATQIALGSAIILAIACLVIILWKSCKRRRDLTRRRAAVQRCNSVDSLTSGQRIVLDRLRHRPPGYYDRHHIRIEKPPTYEETVEQPLRFPIINLDQQAGSTAGLPQPPNPPSPNCYAETRFETPCLSQHGNSENLRESQAEANNGIDNHAFVITDEKEGIPDSSNAAGDVPSSDLHM